jgi:hypothetical protein
VLKDGWYAGLPSTGQRTEFLKFHKKQHRYIPLKGKTASDVIQEAVFNSITLATATKFPELDHVPDGEVVFVSFIRMIEN